MNLRGLFGHAKPRAELLPAFIRDVQDIRGVRVVRLQGAVGKEIGAQYQVAEQEARSEGASTRPLLLDFSGTSGWDFSTVSYLVQAMRSRMATGAKVGIINPSPQLLAEFEIAKLRAIFLVFASEEQAIAAISPEGLDPGKK